MCLLWAEVAITIVGDRCMSIKKIFCYIIQFSHWLFPFAWIYSSIKLHIFFFQFVVFAVQPHTASSSSSSSSSFSCEKCNKSFSSKEGYQNHMKAHVGIYKFKCDQCNKGFTCIKNYKEHLSIHTGLSYFPCNKCRESFSSYYLLKKHRSSCL